MEPRLKSTRLIDGEVKGIMDNTRSCHIPGVNAPTKGLLGLQYINSFAHQIKIQFQV